MLIAHCQQEERAVDVASESVDKNMDSFFTMQPQSSDDGAQAFAHHPLITISHTWSCLWSPQRPRWYIDIKNPTAYGF